MSHCNSRILRIFQCTSLAVLLLTACTSAKKDPEKTLHLSIPTKIKGLDPATSDDLPSVHQLSNTYETLFHYHYLKRPYVLEPQLAAAMPTLSSDKKTYTFKIKSNIRFQDDPCFKDGHGRELDAEDFIFAMKRLADPKINSPGWWTIDGKIVGLNQWRDAAVKSGAADYSKPVEGMKALDPLTLRIELTTPSYQFIYILAMSYLAPMAHEAVEKYGNEIQNHPVGTGPFVLTEFNPSSKVVWDKNPHFREEFYPSEGSPGDQELGLLADSGKRLPLVDRVVGTIVEESQPRWLAFMSGGFDLSTIPKDEFDRAVGKDGELLPDLKKKGISLTKSATLEMSFGVFNIEDPILGKNKLLRQAISLAHDSVRSLALFYNNRGAPAQGPIPPGLTGYDPKFKNPYVQFNLVKAKEFLKKAGYPNGEGLPAFEILSLANSTSRQHTEYFESEMAAIGIKTKVNAVSWPQFLASIRNKQGQFWWTAWVPDYPDAENFLALFYSKNVSPGANESNYVNPKFDELYDQAKNLPDCAARTALYQKMSDIVTEDSPHINDMTYQDFTVTQRWMKNYKYSDETHDESRYYQIDPNLKK